MVNAEINLLFVVYLMPANALEFSCEHPPVELNEEKMLEGKHGLAGHDARVFASWNEVLGSAY